MQFRWPDIVSPKRLRSIVLLLVVGVLTTLGFAPFDLVPLAIAGPAVLLWRWHGSAPRRAFWDGWLYGIALLGSGVSWLHISIDQFGNVGTFMAVLITATFILAVALFFGVTGWLGARLSVGHPLAGLLLFWPALWVLMEWVRGWFLTGFPWLALGYAQIGWPLDGLAPWLGVYGVSWGAMLSAGALVLLVIGSRPHRIAVTGGLIILWCGAWALGQPNWSRPSGAPLQVSLVQGNIPQELKWRPEQRLLTLALYLRLTREHWSSDLVIWPETAVPSLSYQVEDAFLKPLAAEAVAQGSEILLGVPVYEEAGDRIYNAMETVGPIRDRYYKRHLVPFGEFMPLKPLLEPLIDWLAIPMSDFSPGTAGQPLLTLAGHPAGISICYEDAFGEEVIEALPQAEFLVNASNDAWFGDSLAPPQHLQIARMRSRETERYLLRSTNTGISAIIGPRGELQAIAPPFTEQVLTATIQPLQGLTPYGRFGNWLPVALASLCLGLGWLVEQSIGRSPSPVRE